MAKFADMTAEQRLLVSLFVGSQFRPSVGQAARALAQLEQLVKTYRVSGVKALVEALESGEPIPNETNLAGTQPICREDVVSFMNAADGLLKIYYTEELQTEYAKIAGFQSITG